jgi:hypothetical protein
MPNPIMTVANLRSVLSKIGPEFDNCPVAIWLPDSRVDLHQLISRKPVQGSILIEGNLRPGGR